MNIYAAAVILQLILVVSGSETAGERKRVGCYYLGMKSERYGTLLPEDIDASLCTQIVYLHGAIHNETHEIILKPLTRTLRTGGDGYVPKLAKLKSVNPDVKLLLHVAQSEYYEYLVDPTTRSNVIQNAIRWLNESGFDGLELSSPMGPERMEIITEFLCKMKNEFDKYGYMLAISLTGAFPSSKESYQKLERCSDYISLITHHMEIATHRVAAFKAIKADVQWFIENGISPNKILITSPAFGSIFRLANLTNTEMGAPISGPGSDDRELMFGVGIPNKELLKKMNDSSLGWTIRRDNETEEPYAFTTTGLWVSYEDTASVKYRANYVMQEGLGGMSIVSIEFEDNEGIGGEGTFPLTRTLNNVFGHRNETAVNE